MHIDADRLNEFKDLENLADPHFTKERVKIKTLHTVLISLVTLSALDPVVCSFICHPFLNNSNENIKLPKMFSKIGNR